VAEAYKRTTLETIALAKEAGITVLNMHLSRGAVYTLPERKLYFFDEYRSDYLANVRSFRDACEAAIGDANVRICVENCNGWLPFMHEALETLLQSPVFQLTYDIGHNHCAAGMDEPWILAHENRLKHMHMHDARRDGQDHLALGTGEMDIRFYHDLARKNDCTVVLETKTLNALRESVAWLRQQGLKA
jgi:sugar phosphate isomerase/epimerase